MKKYLFLFCFFYCLIHGEKIDIVGNFMYLGDIPTQWQNLKDEGYEVRLFHHTNFQGYLPSYSSDVKKVIIMNDSPSSKNLKIPKEKLIVFLWEPDGTTSCGGFVSKIYTHNDSIIDGKKYFKFYYPFLMPLKSNLLSFEKKKLCTMVARHWTKERVEIINFFEKKPKNEFEFYGSNPGNFSKNLMYKGSIAGLYNSEDKIEVLNHYKFCFCFENSFIPGYITEKIFVCLAAGCIPVYLGAPNILEYIPKDCFIDYGDFESLEELYCFMKEMSKEIYNKYIKNISDYLKSDKAYLFSPSKFDEIIFEALSN
jgi:hypothetical protein